MNFNRKRHLLLKVLSRKLLEYPKKRGEKIDGRLVGLTFEEIDVLLQTDQVERHLILSELISSEEIINFNTNSGLGVFIEPRIGVSAFSNKKYLNRNWQIIKQWTLNFVQIVIPVLSLLIAALVVIKKDNRTIQKIELLEQKLRIP